MRRMPSIVSMASLRRSSSPVETGRQQRIEEEVVVLKPVAFTRDLVDAVATSSSLGCGP